MMAKGTNGKTKADIYRERAVECEERAKKVSNPVAQMRYIETARGWRELAEYAENPMGFIGPWTRDRSRISL